LGAEPLYSDAHPEFIDEEEEEHDAVPVKTELPAEGQEQEEAKEVPAAAETSAPAEVLITQSYIQKALLFMVILGVVLYILKRRRAGYQKVDEKSMV